MLILLSPAKIQNFKKEVILFDHSLPIFLDEASYLIKLLKKLSPEDLSSLLQINKQLSDLNFERNFKWELPFSTNNSKQAALAYDGEVYRGLNFRNFSNLEREYGQQHLRFLSGLYGVLKPLDLIQPYRLEISSKLKNKKGNDMYKFWSKKITAEISSTLNNQPSRTLLNLMSGEYSKALDFKNLKAEVISPEFFEAKSDKLKQIVIYTKRARGLMAAFAIKERIENPEDLIAFNSEGYTYDPLRSTKEKPIFIR